MKQSGINMYGNFVSTTDYDAKTNGGVEELILSQYEMQWQPDSSIVF